MGSFCKTSCTIILEYFFNFLVYSGCIISVIFAYFQLTGRTDIVSTSLYVIAIPFYVYIAGYILYLLKDIYEDHVNNKISIGDLLCSIYSVKIIYAMLERAFYSGLFFVTLYLLADYDQNNTDQNYQVSRYIYALSIYVFLTWCRHWIGSFVEWIYLDGSFYFGNNIDENNDKETVQKSKLFRIYLFEKSSNGISMTFNGKQINFTSLLDPIRPCCGVALYIISESLTKNSSSMLMSDMANAVNIVQIGILTSVCINTLIMIIFACKFGSASNNCCILFGVYLIMILSNLNYLLPSYFYNGMAEYFNNSALDPVFLYYILGLIAYHLVLKTIFTITALYAVCKASRMINNSMA